MIARTIITGKTLYKTSDFDFSRSKGVYTNVLIVFYQSQKTTRYKTF